MELEAFQREVYAHVPVPPGADGIPDYPADAGWQVPGRRAGSGPNGVAHYALVDDLSSPDRPAGQQARAIVRSTVTLRSQPAARPNARGNSG
jgi:hypothetical protein